MLSVSEQNKLQRVNVAQSRHGSLPQRNGSSMDKKQVEFRIEKFIHDLQIVEQKHGIEMDHTADFVTLLRDSETKMVIGCLADGSVYEIAESWFYER